jgi:manganese efflux pump family protein
VVGLLIGEQLATTLGHAARWISGGLLIVVGVYALVKAARAEVAERRSGVPGQPDIGPSAPGQPAVESGAPRQPAIGPGAAGLGRLLVAGLALSLDNLVVGFALGTYRTSIAVAALVIGAVSVALSLIGLELGARIGRRAGDHGGQLAGLVLISVGIAIASGALS